MATRGWDSVTLTDIARLQKQQQPAKRSKYRNVKVTVGTERFDSEREANYWIGLKAREKAGEISDLTRQYPLDLRCPHPTKPDASIVVARYIADFRYLDEHQEWRYVDAKGHRTQMYILKAKWLRLQEGIIVEEV